MPKKKKDFDISRSEKSLKVRRDGSDGKAKESRLKGPGFKPLQ